MNITLRENETMQDLVERLAESFEMVYDIAPVAYWYENLNEDGRIKDIHFSKRMRDMLGYKSVEEFPDELNTLMTFTHPDDVHLMLDDAIRAGTGEIDKYDVQYRIRKVDGDYMWCNATGELVKDHTGKTVGMYGAFIDVSEEIDLQRKQLEQIELAKANRILADNNASILALEDNFISLYDVDMETGRYVTYTRKHLLSDEEFDNMVNNNDFFQDTLENVVRVIVPEDRDGIVKVLNREYIREALENNDSFDWSYRLSTEGGYAWARMRIVYKDTEKKNIIVGVFDAGKDVKAQQLAEQNRNLQESRAFLDYLLSSYVTAYYINLSTKEYKTYKGPVTELGKTYAGGDDYQAALSAFFKMVVHPDDLEGLLEIVKPERLKEELKKGEVTYIFRDMRSDPPSIIRLQGISGADENSAALAFREITDEYQEQQRRLLGAVPISPDILAKENIGMWAFELDEGKPPRMYGDDAMIKLVGLDHQVPPEEMYHAWYDQIDDGSYQLVQDAVDKMMAGEHAEVQYPWHHPDGHTMIVRCGGVRNPEYTNGIRVEGTHQNVTEVLHFDDEQRKALEENNARMLALEDNIVSIYDLDLETGEYELYVKPDANDHDITSQMIKGDDFYEDAVKNIAAVAYPEDKDDLLEMLQPEHIRKTLDESGRLDHYYRLMFGDTPVWARMRVVYKNADKRRVIIGAFNAEKERETEQLQEALHIADEANESNKLVLGFVNGIKWTYTLDDNDQVIDVKYDDAAIGKFDIDYPEDPLAWTKLIHPDDKEQVIEAFGKCLKDRTGEAQIDFAYRLLGMNGEYQWSKATGRTIIHEDGSREITGITLDVTEQMEKERERQQQLEEQLALSDGLAREYHTVWLVDGFGDHRLHLFRSTGKKTVQRAVQRGLDEPTYDGTMVKYVMDSVHEDDRERVLEASKFETVVRETPDVGTYVVSYKRYCDDEGNVDYHQMCFAKAVAPDGTANYILAFRDADKMLREQIANQKRLAEALSMAESANRAKTTFLNNMSHDIRTPMNAIIGYAGLAASHIDNKEQVQDYLSKIGQSSDHLLSLINDVLDMSRIESGKMNLDEKPENLSDIIHTLKDIIQADIRSKQLDFYVDAVDVNDEDIVCDKLRLNQVLLNVLSNAIKYTAAGGTVAMRVREKTVKQSGYGSYEFCIKDNGMGMDDEFLKHIFDPFERVKSSTISGIQGTGLGMAITKNIVDMMGGEIEITSRKGEGTEVIINFDFKLQSEPKAPEEIPELKGVRALVADDDSDTCLSICSMLADIGMRDEWCTSGKEAVIRAGDAHRRGDSFKVYIIDWIMPDMNGIETTRRIRRVIGDDAPIIILTAYDWSDIEEEAKEAGVTAFVSKPMFPSDLHRVLNGCLGREPEKKQEEEKKYDFSGKKVLLVEDNELNREIAVELLRDEGFIVDTAEDGDVAVEIMKKAEPHAYDVVLMDIQMPHMDGYEATRIIRTLPPFDERVPIIAMTANAFEEDRKAAIESGMDEHIPKPIDMKILNETLERFL